jgi:cytochrome c oxidase cbb3-type subunit III
LPGRNNFGVVVCFLGAALTPIMAQAPAQPPAQGAGRGTNPAGGRGGRGGGFANAYPQREAADPAMVERGKATYGVNCAFCHGSDARGGEGGPNLIRSQVLLNDQHGELLAPVVQKGIPDRGMPKFDMTAAQISDIAAFIHSFRVGGYDISRMQPPSVVVGDAKAGEAYFKGKCAGCHSGERELKGIATRIADPKALQQTWLIPGSGRGRGGFGTAPNVSPTTVTVTAGGQKFEGRLIRIDDFIVTLANADGTQRTFRRDGDVPKVEVHDPLEPHKKLIPTYTDKDIHNVTAYLVTLK